jgi:hypothetical protein
MSKPGVVGNITLAADVAVLVIVITFKTLRSGMRPQGYPPGKHENLFLPRFTERR